MHSFVIAIKNGDKKFCAWLKQFGKAYNIDVNVIEVASLDEIKKAQQLRHYLVKIADNNDDGIDWDAVVLPSRIRDMKLAAQSIILNAFSFFNG